MIIFKVILKILQSCRTQDFFFFYVNHNGHQVLKDISRNLMDYLYDRLWNLCKHFKARIHLHLHLADTFIQSDLHCIQVTVLHLISSCFPWESNPWSWRCWRHALPFELQESLWKYRATNSNIEVLWTLMLINEILLKWFHLFLQSDHSLSIFCFIDFSAKQP